MAPSVWDLHEDTGREVHPVDPLAFASMLSEPEALRFSRLSRQGDGFFVKLSYLFRL